LQHVYFEKKDRIVKRMGNFDSRERRIIYQRN